MLSDLTDSARGPQHRCTSLLADSKHRGRCRHNRSLTPIMQFLWRDTEISQRYRAFTCSSQGLSQCFGTRAPQNIASGPLRNGKINKHSWNIATISNIPRNTAGIFVRQYRSNLRAPPTVSLFWFCVQRFGSIILWVSPRKRSLEKAGLGSKI